MYHQLKAKAELSPHFEVYHKDIDMPADYHFSKNPRIAPIWIVPEAGWAIVKKTDYDIAVDKPAGKVYNPKGLHGYDYKHPLMRAIFVARGPAFPHQPHSRVEAFRNMEVYNIICDSLGIDPSPNSGQIRLPFKPVGLHSDDEAPQLETPDDLPPTGTGSITPSRPTPPSRPSTPSLPSLPAEPIPPIVPGVPQPPPPPPSNEEKKPTTVNSILSWVKDVFRDITESISGLFNGSK